MSGRLCIFKENMVYEAQRKVILEIAELCIVSDAVRSFVLFKVEQ